MEDFLTESQMVKLGNFKDTMKTVCPDLCMEDSRMHTKGCAVQQRSRAKNNKNSIWDTMVDT